MVDGHASPGAGNLVLDTQVDVAGVSTRGRVESRQLLARGTTDYQAPVDELDLVDASTSEPGREARVEGAGDRVELGQDRSRRTVHRGERATNVDRTGVVSTAHTLPSKLVLSAPVLASKAIMLWRVYVAVRALFSTRSNNPPA